MRIFYLIYIREMTMMNVKARAVNPDSKFFATEIQRRDLDKHDVLIEIKYAGICHSDIHTAREEWCRLSTRTRS